MTPRHLKSPSVIGQGAIGANVLFQFEKASPFRPRIARTMPHLGQCDAIATGRYISPATSRGTGACMQRTFAIVIAGAGIFASVPITNAWACDDDRYPCPIRSEALIQETVQAPDQLAPDEPQKKSAPPQKKAKQPASTNEKAQAKRERAAPRTPAGTKMSKPGVPEKAPEAVSQKAPEAAPARVASPRADEQPLADESRGGSLLATAGTAWPVPPITKDTPAAASISTADAASNAVQMVDPNEVNELDRAAIDDACIPPSGDTNTLIVCFCR